MATKRASLVRVDEDYIDMLMSPYTNLPSPLRNSDIELYKGKQLPDFHTHLSNTHTHFARSHSSLQNSSFLHSTHGSSSQSRRFSSYDANPLPQWSTYDMGRDLPKKQRWSKKLKHVGQKINSYIKSLFTKTACSTDKFSAVSAKNVAEVNKQPKSVADGVHRDCVTKVSSGSSSSSSSSSFSELECSIEEAIAHCKKTHQWKRSNKSRI